MGCVFLRFPEGKLKAMTLSYDDGVDQDERLIGIMRANGLRGTFNISAGLYPPEGTVFAPGVVSRRLTKAAATALYSGPDVEVALHGYEHPHLEQLSPTACLHQIIEDRRALEEQFGCFVRGMAYPFGKLSDETVEIVRACGIRYARTAVATHGFELPTDWLRMGSTCHHTDPQLMPLLDEFLTGTTWHSPWLFYLWGHGYELERDNSWDLIERFAELAGGHADIWYATNGEICDYVQAFDQLVCSVDGKRMYNPTCTPLWFAEWDGAVKRIGPGETLVLA